MTVSLADVSKVLEDAINTSPIVGPAEPVRDGFATAARDCLSGFRITIQEIPFDEVDRLAHPEQYDREESA